MEVVHAIQRLRDTVIRPDVPGCVAPPTCAQVALFVSVLFTLRWPLAIMENVCGLLSGGWLGHSGSTPCDWSAQSKRGCWMHA